jgi:antirestriction protein ArdC
MANKLYSEITNAILTELEKGGVPWRKDWRSTASAAIPHNVISKRPYSGVNVILLGSRASNAVGHRWNF